MSLLNDITAATGYRAQDGRGRPNLLGATAAPGAPSAAQSLQSRFGGVFQDTFSSSMADVYVRGVAGEFDDPTLRLQEQAAMERLRIAREAAASSAPTGATPASTGSDAAPDAAGTQPATTGPIGSTTTTATSGAAAPTVAAAEQRELYALRVRQSEARLHNISSSLAQDFPKAAQLSSASTGTWDPATFQPRTRGEVEAFAQRMVIDATESAARLEIVKTQLDAARFELANGGGAQVQQLVTDLEAAYGRQKSYVDKLSKIVDQQSGGQVTVAGTEALNGRTMRDAGDVPVAELAAELRASGMDEDQVKRLIGAGELGVEQEKTPGGSPRLKKIANDMTAALLANFNRVREQHREEYQRQELERADERRVIDRRSETRRVERQRADQSSVQSRQRQQSLEEAQSQRDAQRQAEFEQWMATLAAADSQQQQGAQAS